VWLRLSGVWWKMRVEKVAAENRSPPRAVIPSEARDLLTRIGTRRGGTGDAD
jgi:hypothetical protein